MVYFIFKLNFNYKNRNAVRIENDGPRTAPVRIATAERKCTYYIDIVETTSVTLWIIQCGLYRLYFTQTLPCDVWIVVLLECLKKPVLLPSKFFINRTDLCCISFHENRSD